MTRLWKAAIVVWLSGAMLRVFVRVLVRLKSKKIRVV